MIKRFDWLPSGGPQKLWTNLREDGIAWFRLPNAIAEAEKNRYLFVEKILKRKAEDVQFFEVKVIEGTTSYQTTNSDALFHSDISPQKQPDLQVMLCKNKAKSGGESQFIDTWKILAKIKKKDPHLYKLLFTHNRPIRTIVGLYWTPTFSWRHKNFVCSHVPFVCQCDDIGKQFLEWVNREKPIELLLEPGDVYVANNLRMLHGRKAFKGSDRLYYRMLTILKTPMEHPVEHALFARKIASYMHKIESVL